MNRKGDKSLIVGLDIGTSKVTALVGEYSPGGGWYSRLLGHYLGGEGELVGLFANPLTATSDPARQQAIRDAAAKFPADVAGWTGLPADRFKGMTLEGTPQDQLGTFDRIVMIRALHGPLRGNIADGELRALRSLLKDDGMLGVVQHRARADAPFSYADGSKGYLREADVIALMQTHGFELVGKSEVNANPRDTKRVISEMLSRLTPSGPPGCVSTTTRRIPPEYSMSYKSRPRSETMGLMRARTRSTTGLD